MFLTDDIAEPPGTFGPARVDFTNLWAGQAVRLGRDMPAAELTRALAGAALIRLSQMAGK